MFNYWNEILTAFAAPAPRDRHSDHGDPRQAEAADFISRSMLANAVLPLDILGDYVKRMNGRTFTVYSPSDFNSALRQIELAIH